MSENIKDLFNPETIAALKTIATKETPVNEHVEDIYNRMFDLVGVRPVDYGFGFIRKGDPSTITFDEAMETIVTFLENDDIITVGTNVVFIDKDDWIDFGSKGVVASAELNANHASFYVDFSTGIAAGRRILCSEYNLNKVPKLKAMK